MTEAEQARFILESINWSFSTPFSVGRSDLQLFDGRKYHWYPATFIPEIPYALIEILTEPGDVVYDPFAGIGTTIFQALLLGRKPFATEVGRIPVEFVKSMLVLLDPRTSISELADECAGIRVAYNPSTDYSEMMQGGPADVEHLRPWFSPSTFNQLMYLTLCETECCRTGVKAAMRISLSATLKAVCAQDRGWGCIADNMHPKPNQLEKEKDALGRFERNLNVLGRDVLEARKALPLDARQFLAVYEPSSYVARVDAREATNVPDGSVDLVVTSPPYPDMTDYSTSQRLSYYWLGADPMEDLAVEIGARRKRFRSASVQKYVAEMVQAVASISRKLKPNGYAALVMPSFKGEKDSLRKQAIQGCLASFLHNGCVLEHELDRILPTRRRHHNQGWTTLDRERIYIYKKVA